MRSKFLISLIFLATIFLGAIPSHSVEPTATIEQAAVYFALGSLDAAENEVRRFISENPNHPRMDEAIKLLTEIKIELERERIRTLSGTHSGAVANIEPDRNTAASPRIADPRILTSPSSQIPLNWKKMFPGTPSQYRKDGVYAVTAKGEGRKTTITIHFVGGTGEWSQQKIGTMIAIDIPGLLDAMPRGGLDLDYGAVKRVRHSQLSAEPLVTRIVIDLRDTAVSPTIFSGEDEIVIEMTEQKPSSSIESTGLYRPPVSTERYFLEIMGGNFQRGLVADPLSEALTIRVTDASTGAPLSGIKVAFKSVATDLKIDPSETLTDAGGVATTRVALDRTAGRKIVSAQVEGTPAEASFELYALPRPPDTVKGIGYDDIRVRTRQSVSDPLIAIVQDVYGNPVPGVKVEWSYIKGNGTIDADPETPGNQNEIESDRDGKAILRSWSTGAQSGEQILQASFTTGEITRFTQFKINVMPQLVSMDFYQTPVPDILRFLGRIANWNLIISDGVNAVADANVTVHFENMPIDDALDKILAMKSLTRLEEPDGSIRIMTFVEAQTRGQNVITDPELLKTLPQDVVRTVMIPVRGRNMEQLVASAKELLTPDARVITDPVSGQIVITDFIVNIRRVYDIIERLGRGFESRIFRLENLKADSLKDYLANFIGTEDKIFPGQGGFVFVGSSATAEQLSRILTELDKPENVGLFTSQDKEATAAVTKVFQIRFTLASAIVPILDSLFKQTELQVGLDGQGTSRSRRRATPQPTEEGEPTPQQRAQNQQAQSQVATQKILSVSDDRTNKLIVTAPKELMNSIEILVAELDTVVSSVKPIIVHAQGVDLAKVEDMIRTMYPGIKIISDVPSGQLVLFVDPQFDKAPIEEIVKTLRSVSPAASVKPFVINTAGLDPQILEQMMTALYPGTKMFIDPKLGKAVLLVPMDFDEVPVKRLIESFLDTGIKVGDTLIVRRLKYANAVALQTLLKNLQTEAAGLTNRARQTQNRRDVALNEYGEPVVTLSPGEQIPSTTPTEQQLMAIAGTRINQLKVVPVEWLNALILIGPNDVVSSISKMVDMLDQRTGVWDVVPIKNADAVDVAPILQQIFPTARLMAERSSNSVFIIVNTQEELPEIKKAIDYLDQRRGTRMDDTTVVVQLRRADATEVTNILLQIFSNAALEKRGLSLSTSVREGVSEFFNYLREQNRRAERENILRIFPVVSKNLLVIQAPVALVSEALKIVEKIETAEPFSDPTAGQYVKVYYLQYLLPSQLVDLIRNTIDEVRYEIQEYVDPSTGRTIKVGRNVQLIRSVAEDSLKSLIAFATTREHVQIEELIRSFDNDTFAGQRELQFYKIELKKSPATIVGKWLRDNVMNQNNRVGEMMYVNSTDSKIMIWAYSATWERIKRVIPMLDRVEFAFSPYRIFTNPVISADNLTTLITTLYPGLTNSMIVMDDVNALIVLADQSVLDEIDAILKQLEKTSDRIVLKPKHQTAENLQTALVELFPGIKFSTVTGERGFQAILVQGAPDQLSKVEETFKKIDEDVIVFDSYIFKWAPLSGIWQGQAGGINLSEEAKTFTVTGNLIAHYWVIQGNVVGMWGTRADLDRVANYFKNIDELYRDHHRPDKPFWKFITVKYRTVSEIKSELALLWPQWSQDIIAMAPPYAPRSQLLVFSHSSDAFDLIEKSIAEFDTITPYRVFQASHLSSITDLVNTITSIYPDLQTTTVGSQGFEKVLVRGAIHRLNELANLWDELDTSGKVVIYRPVYRKADELTVPLQTFMPSVGVTSVTGTAFGSDILMLYGEPKRIDEALSFVKKMDVTGDVRVLKYGRMNTADASAIVTAFYPNVSVQTISNGNILTAQGTKESLDGAEKLLSQIENGLMWKIVPLARISAVEAQSLVTTLFGSVQATQLPNGIGIVLLGSEEGVAEALEMIRQIDSRRIHLVPIKNVELTSITSALKEFYPEAQVVEITELNSLSISADSIVLNEIDQFVSALDKKLHSAIRPLRYYDPSNIDKLQAAIVRHTQLADNNIGFDDQMNAVMMQGSFEQIQSALKMIDDLDQPTPQVLIEAAVVEVVLNDQKNLGFTWGFRPDLSAISILPYSPYTAPDYGGAQASFDGNGLSLGIARNNLQMTVSALVSNADARVVSAPKLVTRSNKQATVDVGRIVYYPQQTTTTSGGASSTSTNWTSQTVPATLTITPSVARGSDNVRMDVSVVIGSDLGQRVANAPLNVQNRTVTTNVDVIDGQTLILGGLITKNVSDGVVKVPLLGDIPGIGKLFQNTTKSEVNSEVLILISPRIIYPSTQELQMEEEINRYKYLVSFPADWSGRRWLVNNPQRRAAMRRQAFERSNYVVGVDGAREFGATEESQTRIAPAPETTPTTPPASTTIAPTFTAPSNIPAPIQPAPSTLEPPVQEPTVQEPTVQEPTVQEPTVQEPTVQPPFLGSLTSFDINSATAAELRTVPGMPAHIAELIVKYRDQNGKFEKTSDLLQVPGMNPGILDKVNPYLRVSPVSNLNAPLPQPAVPPTPQPTSSVNAQPAVATPAATTSSKVNLNTATIEQLKTVPGILDHHARMITAYRNTYGNFQTTDQLIDVPGITADLYGKIREYVTVSSEPTSISTAAPAAVNQPYSAPTPQTQPTYSSVGRVNINTASEAQLLTVSDLTIQNVKLIVAYRKSYGNFSSVDDLLQVPGITPELLAKIRDRLTVGGSSEATAPPPPYSSRTSPLPSAPAVSTSAKIDINSATEAELKNIPELSTQNIKLLIAYRASYGKFSNLDELLDVPTFTPELLAKIRGKITAK